MINTNVPGHGLGITPAWAGKRRRVLVKLAASRDHPRVGGEKPISGKELDAELGSPPRGRGKGVCLFPALAAIGITPAWAGKSDNTNAGLCNARDHPRVGGEK